MTRRIRRARRDYRARKLGQWENYGVVARGYNSRWRLAYTGTMYMDPLLADRIAERTRQPFFRPRQYRCSWEHAVVNATLFAPASPYIGQCCIYANVQVRETVQIERKRKRERGEIYPTNVRFLTRILNGTFMFRDKSLRSLERSPRENSTRLMKIILAPL